MTRPILPLMFAAVLVAASFGSTMSQCTICQNAEPVSLPDTILDLPGFPPLQCGRVDATLIFLIPNETSSDCETVQSLGSLCGCPSRADSCPLCPSGNLAGSPLNELPFFSDLFLGNTPSCQILEAYLKSHSNEEPVCFVSQSFISGYCGCDSDGLLDEEQGTPCSLCPDGEQASQPGKNVSIPDLPFQTCGQLEDALGMLLKDGAEACGLMSQAFASYCGCTPTRANSCSLCRDGSHVSDPFRPVELLKDEFGGIVPSCAVYESFVAGLEDGSKQCSNAQLFGTICGCPAVQDHCVFCPGESVPDEYLNTTVGELAILYDFTMTCGEAEAYLQYQIEGNSDECIMAQHSNYLCGCNDGRFSYFGANSTKKQAALAWTPRISAFFSCVGSLLIIWDIMSSKQRKRAIYSQLVLGMSIFDLIGSIAWGLSTLPIPKYNRFGMETPIYGAMGNEATCTAQGFAVQLNFTSMFYNISLSTYYLLVIVYEWRDIKLKRNRWWLHGLPLMIGFGLAFGGLPFYRNTIFACHIQNPPIEKTWYPIVFLTFVPIFSTILFTTLMMIRVYLKVRTQSRKAARWRFAIKPGQVAARSGRVGRSSTSGSQASGSESQVSSGTRSRRVTRSGMGNLEREVFYQSLYYLSAFYLCWSFLLTAHLSSSPALRGNLSLSLEHLYGLFVAALAIAPLQGFWNCCVYFRPRMLARWRRKKGKSSNMLSSAARGASSPFASKMHFRRTSTSNTSTRKHTAETERLPDKNGDQKVNEPYDPSAAIAMLDSSDDINSAIDGGERAESVDMVDNANVSLAAIREEFEQRKVSESEIEEFSEE